MKLIHYESTLPCINQQKEKSVALVSKRTIQTERPPLVGQVTSGQIFWLQIQRSGFDSRRYQIF
jgi:hypothetical protein